MNEYAREDKVIRSRTVRYNKIQENKSMYRNTKEYENNFWTV